MRITGLATGLDMDQVVKDSMKPYRMKIDRKGQEKEVLEVKQKLYREVIKDSREFHTKYFENKDSLLRTSNYGTSKFTSSDETSVMATGLAGAKVGNYKVTVEALATPSKTDTLKLDDLKDKLLSVEKDGKVVEIDLKDLTTEKDIAKKLNSQLSKIGMQAEYSEFAGGVVISSKEIESNTEFTLKSGTRELRDKVDSDGNPVLGEDGQPIKEEIFVEDFNYTVNSRKNARVKLEDDKGNIIQYGDNTNEIPLASNNVVVDGIEFKFYDVTSAPIKVSGKTDTTGVKDKLVNFINDYNKLIEKLNTLTTEKRDKSFMPLTAEQKKGMSESEIKLWDEKVKKGQLSRDSDLSRIANSMKEVMRSSVEGSKLTLEKIGIKPVKDYRGAKNGTFTIDERMLTEALEQDSEEVMNLFIKSNPAGEGISDNEKYAQTGLMQRLEKVLYDETVTVSAPIIKKAGIEGSTTSYNNEISQSIEKYDKKMKDMEKDFSRREQLLYTKYSKFETMMNKYNSQQSYLMQQLGGK